jgi:O-antigen/teichoic acid export membrane protein
LPYKQAILYSRIASSTLINILNMTTNIVAGLALTPFFIRELGQESYGIWVLALSLSVVRGALGVFDFGISGSLTKFVAEHNARQDQAKVNEVFSAALIVYLVIGVVLAVAIALFASSGAVGIFRIPETAVPIFRGLLYLAALQTLFDLPAMGVFAALEGIQRFDITRWFNIARIILFALCSVFFLLLGGGVFSLALATFCSELFRLIGQSYWLRRLMPSLRIRWKVSRAVLKAMFALSGQLFIFSLASTLYNQMDQMIIATVLTTNLLIDYDISSRIHTLVFAFSNLIGSFVLSPASALDALNNQSELRRLLMRATRYTAVLTAPTGMIVIVLAEPLTRHWIGPEFTHTVLATQLFVSYLLYWSLLFSGQKMLIGINKLAVILPAFLLSTGINFVISVIAAPHWGVVGVIFGTLVGNIVTFVLYMAALGRVFDFRYQDLFQGVILRVYPPAFTAAFSVAVLAAWRMPEGFFMVGLYGAFGMAVFMGLFILFGMPHDERSMLFKLVKKRLRKAS